MGEVFLRHDGNGETQSVALERDTDIEHFENFVQRQRGHDRPAVGLDPRQVLRLPVASTLHGRESCWSHTALRADPGAIVRPKPDDLGKCLLLPVPDNLRSRATRTTRFFRGFAIRHAATRVFRLRTSYGDRHLVLPCRFPSRSRTRSLHQMGFQPRGRKCG